MTEKQIRDARPESKLSFLWDDRVKGLGCAVYPSGKKAFVLYYRADGKQHRVTLGRPGEMSLEDARKRAGTELTQIRNGEAGPAERRQEAKEAPTVADALARFFSETVPARIAIKRMKQRTVDEYGRQATRYVEPALGSMKVAKVTRQDVERFAATLAHTPVTRNRVLAFLSRIFNLAEAWEWRAQSTNPVKRIERAKEEPRERVLRPSESMALNAALADLEADHPTTVAAIRFAAWTGLRINEVLEAEWANVDFEERTLTVPDSKTGRRTLPLPDAVIDLISYLPRIEGNPYIFAGAKPGSHVVYKTAWKLLAKAYRAAGLEPVKLHDLRRSFATTAAAGLPITVVRDLLGHKTVAMANRYAQTADNLRDAMEQTAAKLAC